MKKRGFTPLETIRKQDEYKVSLTGFTLLEVLLGFAIFTIVMTLVMVTVAGSFKSLRQAEVFMLKEQKQRLCLLRLDKEISSFTRISFPETRFIGENQSFFLCTPRRITW